MTEKDYESYTPAELFKEFREELLKLMASNDVEITSFSLPSGAVGEQTIVSDHARKILEPIAQPLQQSVDEIIDRMNEQGLLHPSGSLH